MEARVGRSRPSMAFAAPVHPCTMESNPDSRYPVPGTVHTLTESEACRLTKLKRLTAGDFPWVSFYPSEGWVKWRLGSESNRRPRLCRPLHNHSATQPLEKGESTPISSPCHAASSTATKTKRVYCSHRLSRTGAALSGVAQSGIRNPESKRLPAPVCNIRHFLG